MPSGLDLLLVALAGWRLAYLLVFEMGPFELVDHMREMIGANADSQASVMPSTFFAKLFACVPCMSFWTVAGLVILWTNHDWSISGEVHDGVRFLGLWGGATALHIAIVR